jgi:hypothetical protein
MSVRRPATSASRPTWTAGADVPCGAVQGCAAGIRYGRIRDQTHLPPAGSAVAPHLADMAWTM